MLRLKPKRTKQEPGIEPEFADAFAGWKSQPTPATTGALLRAVNPVLSTAMQSAGGATNPVLRGHAKSLAVDAFGNYDPARGSLKTHLLTHLQRLKRVNAQSNQIIKLPERLVFDKNRLNDADTALSEEFGRAPSDIELADRTGLPIKRLVQIRKMARPLSEGVFSEVDDEGNQFSPETRSLTDRGQESWLRFVYDDLSPRDQFIMERLLGMHGHRKTPPSYIAKALKISPSAVSQRLASIQRLLDRREQAGLF